METPSKPTLHSSPHSTCSNAVRAFLRAAKVEYEGKDIDFFKGEHKTEDFLKLNPLGKVPVLQVDGLTLRESMVFSRYLCNTRNDIPDNWYPKDPKKRVFVDMGLEYWSQVASRIFQYAYWKFGRSTLSQDDARKQSDEAVTEFEGLFLKDNKFVAGGDKPSLADLPFLFYLIGQTLYTDYTLDKHTRTLQWIKDVFEAEPEVKAQAEDYHKLFGKTSPY